MAIPLQTENLTKIYKLNNKLRTRTAVDGLNLQVPEGAVFGFLGPNGAGKTTTIKMLLDFVSPTSGSASIFGGSCSDPSTRHLIGYLPEQPYFHRFLKPIEVLSMHAALAGVERKEIKSRSMTCLERTGIAEYAYTPIAKLSKGLTQRVGIAQAIVGDAKLLILDEPTSGLDPIGRRHVRDLLLELKQEGKTIFLSSHQLSEVESTCDIVAVMRRGKLVACGAPDNVRNANSSIVIQTSTVNTEMLDRLRFLQMQIEQRGDCTVLSTGPKNIYEVMRAMEEMDLPLLRIESRRETLEEAFLRLAA